MRKENSLYIQSMCVVFLNIFSLWIILFADAGPADMDYQPYIFFSDFFLLTTF